MLRDVVLRLFDCFLAALLSVSAIRLPVLSVQKKGLAEL